MKNIFFLHLTTIDVWFNICVHFDLCINGAVYLLFITQCPYNILLEFKQTITFQGLFLCIIRSTSVRLSEFASRIIWIYILVWLCGFGIYGTKELFYISIFYNLMFFNTNLCFRLASFLLKSLFISFLFSIIYESMQLKSKKIELLKNFLYIFFFR